MTLDYFTDGAETGTAYRANRDAYSQYKIRPRLLRDVSQINSCSSLLDTTISFPLAIAPSGMQRLAHRDGEEATARAAAKAGVAMGVSTFATTTLEDIKRAGDKARTASGMDGYAGVYMLQLYVFKNRETTKKLVKRAEKAGYKALLLTCDTPRLEIDIATQ